MITKGVAVDEGDKETKEEGNTIAEEKIDVSNSRNTNGSNSGGNSSGNGNNSTPAKCPPCPPCARCPEPSFECKKVPNYNLSNNNALPRPVLSSFSQFGL